MTPLRQRFIDDLRLKNFSDDTIKVYVHAVKKFALFLGRSPDESTAEDVRAFMIHQLDCGLSRSYCVILRNALRHLFVDTLGRTDELKATAVAIRRGAQTTPPQRTPSRTLYSWQCAIRGARRCLLDDRAANGHQIC